MNPYLRESLESQLRGEDLIFLYWRLTHILKSVVGPLIITHLWQEETEVRTAADKCPLQKNLVASGYFTLQFMKWPRLRNDLHFWMIMCLQCVPTEAEADGPVVNIY